MNGTFMEKKPTIISSLRFGKCRGSMDVMEDPG